MRLSPDFEIIQMTDEYMAVPIGQKADEFHGVIVLSETAYFLLSNIKEPKTKEEIVALITENYNIDSDTAKADIDNVLGTLLETGIIYE